MMMSTSKRSLFGLNSLLPSVSEPDANVSLENLDISDSCKKFTPLIKIDNIDFLTILDDMKTGLNISQETVGDCDSVPSGNPNQPAITVGRIENKVIITIRSSVIQSSLIANMYALLMQISEDTEVHLIIPTWLNDDTWMSLYSLFYDVKFKLIFHLGWLFNIASFLVLAVADEIRISEFSCIVLSASPDKRASGTMKDVTSMLEFYQKIDAEVKRVAVKSQLLLESEIVDIYTDKETYALFGDNLKNRINARLKCK